MEDFTPQQRGQLLRLVELYLGNMDEGHARVKMDEVMRHIDRTNFAWIGGAEGIACFTIASTAR